MDNIVITMIAAFGTILLLSGISAILVNAGWIFRANDFVNDLAIFMVGSFFGYSIARLWAIEAKRKVKK